MKCPFGVLVNIKNYIQDTMFQTIKKRYILLLMAATSVFAVDAQKAAVKTNFVYWGTTTPNIGAEFALSKKTTLELAGGFNWFLLNKKQITDSNGMPAVRETKFKHWLVQPEFRYWICESFNGHFFGLHAHGGQFNVGGIDIPLGRLKVFKDHRYEGYLYGGGVSYGYQWVLSPRWNFEANIGGGFARIHYKKYPCTTCAPKVDEGVYNYFGVTKAALSLIYFIK